MDIPEDIQQNYRDIVASEGSQFGGWDDVAAYADRAGDANLAAWARSQSPEKAPVRAHAKPRTTRKA